MPRPVKWRSVCRLPEVIDFRPSDSEYKEADRGTVVMTVDEYETIRLIDLEGNTQAECAGQMGISRTTVQGIYIEARRKLADAVVNGRFLKIRGGEYRICNGKGPGTGDGCGRCGRRRYHQVMQEKRMAESEDCQENGGKKMIIGIPAKEMKMEAMVSEHFGRTAYFMVYDTETEKVEFVDNSAAASAGGAGIKAAQAVVDAGATKVISPRMGENAADVLKKADVEIYESIEGSVKENLDRFMEGRLELLNEIHAGFHGKVDR